jgi:hypothetical protein
MKHISNRNFYSTIIRQYSKKLNFSMKKDIILHSQKKLNEKYSEENKQFDKKMQPVWNYMNMIRSPVYLSIFAMIWTNPFSLAYVYLKLFSNYYLIFLTGLEGSAIFSLGVLEYYLVKFNVPDTKELLKLRSTNYYKRIIMMITFFLALMISSLNAQNESTAASGVFLILSNIYLYVKYSLQMGNHMGNSLYLMPRMKFVYTNILLIVCLMVITNKKKSIIDINIKY